jgi:hypothetical protein
LSCGVLERFQLSFEGHAKGAIPVLVLSSRSRRKPFPTSKRERRYVRGSTGKSCRVSAGQRFRRRGSGITTRNQQVTAASCRDTASIHLSGPSGLSIHGRPSNLARICAALARRRKKRSNGCPTILVKIQAAMPPTNAVKSVYSTNRGSFLRERPQPCRSVRAEQRKRRRRMKRRLEKP